MTLIEKITSYNSWCRGLEDNLKFTPTEIGLFLDEACTQLENLQNAVDDAADLFQEIMLQNYYLSKYENKSSKSN